MLRFVEHIVLHWMSFEARLNKQILNPQLPRIHSGINWAAVKQVRITVGPQSRKTRKPHFPSPFLRPTFDRSRMKSSDNWQLSLWMSSWFSNQCTSSWNVEIYSVNSTPAHLFHLHRDMVTKKENFAVQFFRIVCVVGTSASDWWPLNPLWLFNCQSINSFHKFCNCNCLSFAIASAFCLSDFHLRCLPSHIITGFSISLENVLRLPGQKCMLLRNTD